MPSIPAYSCTKPGDAETVGLHHQAPAMSVAISDKNCSNGKELATMAQQRGLVDSKSGIRVNRVLREVDLQPHRRQAWCNTTEKDPEFFQAQVETVCQTYLDALRR
jgi:hypothetical protein